jgi:hypothetical protein
LASRRDGNGVRVDHAEALLEDAVLRLGGRDLLLPRVPDKQRLQGWVDDEAGPKGLAVIAYLE